MSDEKKPATQAEIERRYRAAMTEQALRSGRTAGLFPDWEKPHDVDACGGSDTCPIHGFGR